MDALEHLRSWIGNSEQRTDTITAAPLAGLAATLDRDDPAPREGTAVPPLWHWLYFLPLYRQSEVGGDGHAKRGGFLPPVPLPRRMWAGGRISFERAVGVGVVATRSSRIADVTGKEARSGPLVFVTVQHEISTDAGLALREDHDLVYRGAPAAGAGSPAPAAAPCDE
jgi:3-methylfumaryl-CoA hydratase